ncbi:MAG: PCYCGC motif-containing (lipo)protein [Chloroflexota bacterium]
MIGRGAVRHPTPTPTSSRRRLLAGFGLLIASACAPAGARPPATAAPFVPLLGAHPSRGVWPPEYHRAPTQVREAYVFAVANEASLRFIPCYCGCGANGHTSNYSCYVRSRLPDGGVILDTHGFG